MKQDIICNNCCNEVEKRYPGCVSAMGVVGHPDSIDGPEERVKLVRGTLKLESALCDRCFPAVAMGKGAPCGAFSVSTARTPYFEWEDEYLLKGGVEDSDFDEVLA